MTSYNGTMASDDGEGFFSAAYASAGPSKVLAATVLVATQTVGNALLAGIVWYERCGSDSHFRTIINQLTSSFCLMLLMMNLSLTNVVGLVYFSPLAPFPGPVCTAMVTAANFFLTLGLLILDTIIVLRYLYIFRWKTVGAVNDEFFATFVTINHIIIALLFSGLLCLLGFNYNTNYYFCTNTDPSSGPPGWAVVGGAAAPTVDPRYTYDAFVLLPAFSIALHVFVFVRIYFYRRSTKRFLASCKGVVIEKSSSKSAASSPMDKGEAEEQNRNVSDLATSMLSMTVVFLASLPALLVMSAVPARALADTEPGRVCLALAHFGLQFAASVIVPSVHYGRHKGLRRAVSRRICSAVEPLTHRLARLRRSAQGWNGAWTRLWAASKKAGGADGKGGGLEAEIYMNDL